MKGAAARKARFRLFPRLILRIVLFGMDGVCVSGLGEELLGGIIVNQ
jgi:hypothetical protein